MVEREKFSSNAVIKVIGVGGAGGNAINTMIEQGLSGVEFIAANTDVQALQSNLAPVKIQLGRELTKGLGAGANPEVGRDAALEDKAIIQEVLSGADMVFVTAGTGGGTGTGAAPIIAQVARELGALTVGVVTKPFSFEGKRRKIHSEQGIQSLKASVDTLITIPNQRLLSIAPPQMSMLDGFKLADEVLLNAVKGISDIINIPGRVNVDFADVRTIMSEMGMALMGIGTASGQNRAVEAARAAINSPLLEDVDIEGATGILINITGSSEMTLHEISEASTLIQEAVHEDANIIFGSVVDESMGDTLRVTVIATGFDHARVSLPESHSKMYPTAGSGYGYQTPASVNTNNNPGYGLGNQGMGQRNAPNNFGYGQPTQDPRAHNNGGMNQNMRQDMGMNRSMNNQASQAPVAAGLSLRPSHEVGQPITNARRAEGHFAEANAQMQLRNMQANNPNNHPQAGFGGGYNTQPSHGNFGTARTASIPNTSQSNNAGVHTSQLDNDAALENQMRTQALSSKNEFEELTQWTLELSRQSNNTAGEQSTDTLETEDVSTLAGLNGSNLASDESENEKALRLARELADITPDEGDFETPAFLRRKDEASNRLM
ncbi:MAG: cell division protein FtsZ [Betaproteobacteria bacterium]|nr:cell division protein FtsZ [Betaproteobacteria bacterium]